MPIHIDAAIGGEKVAKLIITRLDHVETPDPSWLYRYVIFSATFGSAGTAIRAGNAVEFRHRYGDGVQACIAKGLVAWVTAKQPEVRW